VHAQTVIDDSLDFKIGQMLMLGFRGTSATPGSIIVSYLRNLHLGGVILFDFDVAKREYGRNILSPTQLADLTEALQLEAPYPLLIAVDQEGGTVARLKPNAGFPPHVSHAWLGEQDDVETTAAQADLLARSLAVVGLNVNFSPVLDLNLNPENPVIGALGRSFGADPELVARHAIIMLESMREQGVLGAIKHFPGHGSSKEDSHKGFVDVSDTWTRKELKPFQLVLESGVCDIVMTAHIFNSNLDPVWPATLSRSTIEDVLRRQLGFRGVVISDDMMMRAITDHYGLETAIKQAVNAGVDILLFANNSYEYVMDIAPRAHATLKALVERGEISQARIDEAWGRIRKLKQQLPGLE